MTPTVKVNVQQAIAAVQSMIDLTENFAPLFIELVGKQEDNRAWTLRGSALQAFSQKRSPFDGGGTWPSLNEKYQKEKAKKFPGSPMLVASGDYFNSLVRANAYSVVIMDKKKLTYGTTTPYAAYHQLGTGRMPARSVLGFNTEQKKAIKLLLQEYVKAAAQGKKAAEDRLRDGIKVT